MTTWTDLPAMAKIEVVVDGSDVPAVRDLFLDAGATGYTAVSGVSGFGHHGHHQGRLLFNDRASLSMLITVVRSNVPTVSSPASAGCSTIATACCSSARHTSVGLTTSPDGVRD
jgi:nitrogen regulatory protein PII